MRLRNRRLAKAVFVQPSEIPGAGGGLFANRRIHPGDVVVHMVDPSRVDAREFSHFVARVAWPQAGIVLEEVGGCKWMVDLVMTSGLKPNWYFINHSTSPNLCMVVKGDGVAWVATRMIYRGEELTFLYNSQCSF